MHRAHGIVRVGAVAGLILTSLVGASASASASTSICPEVRLLAIPAVHRVVGTGSAASCSQAALRRAVGAGGSISFRCGAAPITIHLSAVLPVTRATVVDGARRVTLDGSGRTRIFDVADHTRLSVRNLRLVNASAAASDPDGGAGGAISGGYAVRVEAVGTDFVNNSAHRGGGAIYVGNASRLTISRSRFERNRAVLGGAVYSLLSTLIASDSTFVRNRATSDSGGAILTDGGAPRDANVGGSISVCRTAIDANSAAGQGGGVFLWGYQHDKILLYRDTLSRNVAGFHGQGLGGGARVGIAQEGGKSRQGSVVISKVTFLRNRSNANGGGLYIDCAPLCAIRNATFSQNRADFFGGAVAGDGHHDNGVTYVGNRAAAGGAVAGKHIVYRNVIFSRNTATKSDYQTCIETNSGARVLQWGSGRADRSMACASGEMRGDPKLAALRQQAGGVPVAVPKAGSAALARGLHCLPRDAQGRARPRNCDLGAAERTG